ncbi:MAG: hypothetical protein AB4042_13455 [Leptolyngbyaceae cyanobacterium]
MSSTVLAGVAFSAVTIPLAAFTSETITVQVNEKPVLMGEVRELAPLYLGAATVMSLGVGVVSLSVAGWRRCATKLESTTEKAGTLEQTVQQQSYLIEQLKFSQQSLSVAGLNDTWLPENSTQAQDGQSVPTPSESLEQVAPIASAPPIPQGKTEFGAVVSNVFRQPFGQPGDVAVPSTPGVENSAAQQAIAPNNPVPASTTIPTQTHETATAQPSGASEQAQLQDLMEQMQKMMVRVEQLQAS